MVCALIDYFRPISAREIVQLCEITIRSPFLVCARILMVSFFPHRLTAFVLRSFAQARPFIFVDGDELKHTQNWITRNQNPQSGCFRKSGSLFNKRLKVCVIPKFPAFFHFKFPAFFHFMCCKCWITLANLTLPRFRVVFQMKQRLLHLSQCPFWNPGCLLRYYLLHAQFALSISYRILCTATAEVLSGRQVESTPPTV